MNLTFHGNEDFWSARLAALKTLADSRVDVGLTSSASARSRMLLAIHEHGAPAMRIPARPVIRPALSSPDARAKMADAMISAAESAMAGDESAVTAAMEQAGKTGVDAIHAYIDAGIPPPNAPVTVSGGWIRNRVAKKSVRVEGKGFSKPLYDTGRLYNDFDYEVKRRE